MVAVSKLKVGVDVPWVTSWSAETVTGILPCPSVDGALAVQQLAKPGQGRPQYSRNHLFRQRLSVRSLLCPMCGQPTEAGDRWSQTGRFMAAGVIRARGLGHTMPTDLADDRIVLDAGAIAPLHKACATRAVQHCPHLGAMADTTLKPFPAAWVVTPLMVEARRPAAALNVLAAPAGKPGAPVAVVSFLQLCGITEDRDPDWRP